jgi:SAM-dependent methyltransferase
MAKLLWNLYALCYDTITGLAAYQDMLDEVVTALELSPGMRVMDAGCGTGALAKRLASAYPDVELVAVDLSSSMLKRARSRQTWPPTFTFIEGNIDDTLANDARGFDRIASVNVIWTLPDPQRTFGRMTAGLRAGGRMVHTTPRWNFRPHVIVWDHLRRQKGWAFLRALLVLPMLLCGGLLNLLLVAQSLLLARGPQAGKRWGAKGLVELLRTAGAPPCMVRPCYAGQGHLLVVDKEATTGCATRLPGTSNPL